MSDTFDATGLQIKSLSDITGELTTDFQTIYGIDINLDSDSPDGEMLNIFAQASIDQRELLQKINASFDPDQAEGRILDQRVAINGLTRNSGTYTYQPVEITTTKALSLTGLDDQAIEINPTGNIFTVKDDAGNRFFLLESQVMTGAGTYTFTFRAEKIGKVETLPNTITTPDTIVAGVASINNPSGASSVGVDEESDFDLKNRRRASVAINSIANVDGLQAALNNLTGVVIALVYENDTNVTDVYGVPAHNIWCVVDGGDPDAIGQTILSKKTDGVGMKGSNSVLVPKANGGFFTAYYDTPVNQTLQVRFSLADRYGGVIDKTYIKTLIAANIIWQIGQNAESDTITAYVKGLNKNYIITSMLVSSDGASWAEVVAVTDIQHRFIMDVNYITIT